ncbi:MAG TPA: FmdB family zinc ribbon protein, partial [Chloroflexota bacterium]
MPIYEYECGSCGRRFEQLQRITEDALVSDPDCGGPVRRVIQPVGIIFKGSGFYVNDSRKSSSSSSSSSDSKSDSKPESKSE